jgi:hypothetical protein
MNLIPVIDLFGAKDDESIFFQLGRLQDHSFEMMVWASYEYEASSRAVADWARHTKTPLLLTDISMHHGGLDLEIFYDVHLLILVPLREDSTYQKRVKDLTEYWKEVTFSYSKDLAYDVIHVS